MQKYHIWIVESSLLTKGQRINHNPFHSNLELIDVKARLDLLEITKIIKVR
jgi:hypothetical protein